MKNLLINLGIGILILLSFVLTIILMIIEVPCRILQLIISIIMTSYQSLSAKKYGNSEIDTILSNLSKEMREKDEMFKQGDDLDITCKKCGKKISDLEEGCSECEGYKW